MYEFNFNFILTKNIIILKNMKLENNIDSKKIKTKQPFNLNYSIISKWNFN